MNNKLTNIQTQEQQLIQQQNLTPLQLQVVNLLEMPIAQLEEDIRSEINTNPSLEPDYENTNDGLSSDTSDDNSYSDANDEYQDETERRDDALNDALNTIGQDDRMEDTSFSDDIVPRYSSDNDHTMEDSSLPSFIDSLTEQMRMEDLTETQQQIMEYIICSLDDDGLLRKDLMSISDELAIYYNIFVSKDEIEDILLRLQNFDPAGIGARDLRECLLLQIERMKATPLSMLMYDIINRCYDDFSNNRWQNICHTLHISEMQAEELRNEIRHRLTPKPGSALGETQGRSIDQISPDIILHTDYDNNISFELNNGRIPTLHIVREDEAFLKSMSTRKLSKSERDAVTFTQRNVEKASIYIEALRQREETITHTMKAIIDLQRPYILSGDDSDLRPMVLRDVADRTGYDLSTISRVSKSKYVQTAWGIFPLRHFFNEGYTTQQGDTVSTREIKNVLREVIASENPKHPLSDDKLVSMMKQRGYPIARRTIAKYREQLHIPVARLRRK